MLDLNYKEDSSAIVDMNIVMTGQGKYVELQGTGEETPFTADQLQELLALGKKGIEALIDSQKQALADLPIAFMKVEDTGTKEASMAEESHV